MTHRRCRLAAFVKKGGRRCYLDSEPELIDAFVTVIDTHTAGDPMQEGVLWTNLTRGEIAAGLADEGFEVSVTVVDHLLEEFGMGQRKPQKIKTMRHDPDRDAQFKHIAALKKEYLEAGLPVLSMDTKKREILGDYVRPGRVLSNAPLRGWDHDFATHSQGVVIPHGMYDLALNEGYLHLGDSRETSEFAADASSIVGKTMVATDIRRQPTCCSCVTAAAATARNDWSFKEQLQRVADRTDLIIRVAHYPPGCSKYNPIEHRLFPHVTRQLKGLFLKSIDMFRDLARRATTTTGLRVFARTLRGLYEKGKPATIECVEELRVLFAPVLPKWNYLVLPQPIWEVIQY